MSRRHRITIEPAGSSYSVVGAVALTSPTPVIDAARALRAAGAHDSDLIVAASSIVSICPTSIGSILRRRKTPSAQYVGAHSASFNH